MAAERLANDIDGDKVDSVVVVDDVDDDDDDMVCKYRAKRNKL